MGGLVLRRLLRFGQDSRGKRKDTLFRQQEDKTPQGWKDWLRDRIRPLPLHLYEVDEVDEELRLSFATHRGFEG